MGRMSSGLGMGAGSNVLLQSYRRTVLRTTHHALRTQTLKGIAIMAVERLGSGTWHGDLKGGNGRISTPASGVLNESPFTFATRFENAKGTNPEELIAAAHAACYSMAFSNYLSTNGHVPQEITTKATITLDGGKITKMHLEVRGKVQGMDGATFTRMADEADKKCPVSNLLRSGLAITLDAKLA